MGKQRSRSSWFHTTFASNHAPPVAFSSSVRKALLALALIGCGQTTSASPTVRRVGTTPAPAGNHLQAPSAGVPEVSDSDVCFPLSVETELSGAYGCWTQSASGSDEPWHSTADDSPDSDGLPKYAWSTRNLGDRVIEMTIVGTGGTCHTHAQTAFSVRLLGEPESRELTGLLANVSECHVENELAVLLGAGHQDARYVAPITEPRRVEGRRARQLLEASGVQYPPLDEFPNGVDVSVRNIVAQLDSHELRALEWTIEPRGDAGDTGGTVDGVAIYRDGIRILDVESAPVFGGFVSDGERVAAVLGVRDGSITTWEDHFVELLIDGARLRALSCEPVPAAFADASCGQVIHGSPRFGRPYGRRTP